MRQKLGAKKIAKLKRELGLNIVKVLVRGGTDHRKDLFLPDGSVMYLFKDGTIFETNQTHKENKN